MTTDIPYASTPRPDTGVSNTTLGMWLFIASEVMLFGALFSSYVLLRTGAAAWPDQQATLNVALGAINTVILLASSAAIVAAGAAVRQGAAGRFRALMAASILLGVLFLVVKAFEWAGERGAGLEPATNNFLGLYFTITGLHALHVAAGIVVNAFLWSDRPMALGSPLRFASRVRAAVLYWNFVDVVWLFVFVVLYLL